MRLPAVPRGRNKHRPHPEEGAISAFTRVCDALWRPSRRARPGLDPGMAANTERTPSSFETPASANASPGSSG
jgi:hypothetical protein